MELAFCLIERVGFVYGLIAWFCVRSSTQHKLKPSSQEAVLGFMEFCIFLKSVRYISWIFLGWFLCHVGSHAVFSGTFWSHRASRQGMAMPKKCK